MADRVSVRKDGRLAQVGAPSDSPASNSVLLPGDVAGSSVQISRAAGEPVVIAARR